jgi:putative endonuclease
MYYVYILVCLQTKRSYVGQTQNLILRFQRHLAGSTRTTREKLQQPVIVHWESFATRADSMRRERYFKSGSGHRMKQHVIDAGLTLFVTE